MKNSMKKIVSVGSFLGGIFMFSFVGAQDVITSTDVCKAGSSFSSITEVINWASCLLIRTIVPFLFSLATVAFLWGIIQYYLNPENEEKRKKGKTFIFGGIIALFVMLSMWGLVGILAGTFNFPTVIPQFPGQ